MRASAIAVWDQAALRLAYLERCQRGAGTGVETELVLSRAALVRGPTMPSAGVTRVAAGGDDRLAGERAEDPIHGRPALSSMFSSVCNSLTHPPW